MNRRTLTLAVTIAVVIVLVVIGGLVWSRVANSSSGPIETGSSSHVHTIHILDNGFILLGDQDGLYHALSGGKDWTRYGAPLSHMMPLCVARLGATMLACTTDLSNAIVGKPEGLWRSTDGGKNWSRTPLPDLHVISIATSPVVPHTAVVFAPSDGLNGGAGHGGIWVTTNDGQSWTRVNKARAFDALTGLALLPGKPFTILFASPQATWRGVDGGRSWQVVKALAGSPTLSLAASTVSPSTVFAGLANGVWESDNAGATWRLRWPGGPTPVVRTAFDRADDLYAYIGSHLYRLDGNRRIQAADIDGQPADVAVDPRDPARVYAAFSFPLRIYESNNSGATWKKIV